LNQSDLELEFAKLKKELTDLKDKVRVLDDHQDMVLGYEGQRFAKRIKLRGVQATLRGKDRVFDFDDYGYPAFDGPDDYHIILESHDGKNAPNPAQYKVTKQTGSRLLIASTSQHDANKLDLLLTEAPKVR